MARAFSIFLLAVFLALPAGAMTLILRDDYTFPRAASLAWDAQLCALWVAVEGPRVFLVTPQGRVIRTIEPGMRSVRALTVAPDGLTLADGRGGFQRVTREGSVVGAPFRLDPSLTDVEGIHREASGDLLVVQDDPSVLIRLSASGDILLERMGRTFVPRLEEMQGVARDPATGNILVVDDNEGLNALVELTPEGTEVNSVTPLSEWGYDAEGVAVHGQTGSLFVAFDSGQRIAVFDYLPTRSRGRDRPVAQGPDCPIS